jgi:hypothetical protein
LSRDVYQFDVDRGLFLLKGVDQGLIGRQLGRVAKYHERNGSSYARLAGGRKYAYERE